MIRSVNYPENRCPATLIKYDQVSTRAKPLPSSYLKDRFDISYKSLNNLTQECNSNVYKTSPFLKPVLTNLLSYSTMFQESIDIVLMIFNGLQMIDELLLSKEISKTIDINETKFFSTITSYINFDNNNPSDYYKLLWDKKMVFESVPVFHNLNLEIEFKPITIDKPIEHTRQNWGYPRIHKNNSGFIKYEKLSKFLKRNNILPDKINYKDKIIPIFCPDNESNIDPFTDFYSDCAFQCPFYISKIKYKPIFINKKEIGSLIDDIMQLSHPIVPTITKTELQTPMLIEYHNASSAIRIQDKVIIKGVPGLLLKKIIETFQKKGQTHFYYSDFKNQPDIPWDPINQNFEIRLARLIKRLNEINIGINIKKAGRGCFSFNVKDRLKLTLV